MFCKIYVLEISAKFMRKHLRRSLFFNKVAGFKATILFKKRIPTQVFSCEFWEIFKNVFFIEHLPVTASRFEYITLQYYKKLGSRTLRGLCNPLYNTLYGIAKWR